MKLIELLFSRSSVICLIWFLVFLFGGLRAQSAIGSAEKREQTKKPNETNEAEDKEVEWTIVWFIDEWEWINNENICEWNHAPQHITSIPWIF